VTLVGWGMIRLLFPTLDYFPPEVLVDKLERGWFVNAGVRKAAGLAYLTVALILMAVFFKAVQHRWPGKGGPKGLVFGAWLGVVWSFGFLCGWAFLGTTFRAELLNSVVDFIPLAVAGWLIGLAIGHDVPWSGYRMWKPWLAALLVALGFTGVHMLGTRLIANSIGLGADLLLIPKTALQVTLLFTLGIWVGLMYMLLRAALPFRNTWARVAFFSFGIFGSSWTWFNLFFIIEFTGVLPTILLVGLIGATGIFVGAMAYEVTVRRGLQVD